MTSDLHWEYWKDYVPGSESYSHSQLGSQDLSDSSKSLEQVDHSHGDDDHLFIFFISCVAFKIQYLSGQACLPSSFAVLFFLTVSWRHNSQPIQFNP
jgi:hypothetical protein